MTVCPVFFEMVRKKLIFTFPVSVHTNGEELSFIFLRASATLFNVIGLISDINSKID